MVNAGLAVVALMVGYVIGHCVRLPLLADAVRWLRLPPQRRPDWAER